LGIGVWVRATFRSLCESFELVYVGFFWLKLMLDTHVNVNLDMDMDMEMGIL